MRRKGYSVGFNNTTAASAPMIALDPIVFRELPVIHQIILNETWLEAERRGCHVSPDDRVVRDNVCRVVLRVGEQIRRAAEKGMADTSLGFSDPIFPDAA